MRTRRFILISTLLTALLAAPFTLAGLLLPPQYRDTYLGEFQEKIQGCRLVIGG